MTGQLAETVGSKRLSDRIVALLESETEAAVARWAAQGATPDNYIVVLEINDIAARCAVSPLAVNGAVGWLFRANRIIGASVKGVTYAIGLRPTGPTA